MSKRERNLIHICRNENNFSCDISHQYFPRSTFAAFQITKNSHTLNEISIVRYRALSSHFKSISNYALKIKIEKINDLRIKI